MRRTFIRVCLMMAFAATPGLAQNSSPKFDVASVKVAGRPGAGGMSVNIDGGPGTNDPARISYTNVSLEDLVKIAYGMMGPTYDPAHKNDQLRGPSWLSTERFTVTAKLPAGATKDDFKLMLRNLLTERFKLALHAETKEVSGYALAVGKNGPKIKDAADENSQANSVTTPATFDMDKDGFRVFPPGGTGVTSYVADGVTRLTASKVTMTRWADMLGKMLACPVIDQTGLTGKYDFRLEFVRDLGGGVGRGGGLRTPPVDDSRDDKGVPTLIDAVQSRLGLKLEPKKVPWDTLVIDHVEKTPTEN